MNAFCKLGLIALGIVLFSCNTERTIPRNEIIGLMIDKYARKLPVPPALDEVAEREKKDSTCYYRDSTQIGMIIALHPILDSKVDHRGLNKIPKEYAEFVDVQRPPGHLESVREIGSTKGHNLIIADIHELSKSIAFSNFDMLFHFSNIWFNEENTKAVFELGISRSGLAGSSAIYCLEKQNTTWTTKAVVQTTEW